MGLFDFAANIGKKIFGDDDDASEKLQEHISEDNPGIDNLQVTVEDGVATIQGEAQSADALEKAVLMAGNAMGVTEVRADGVNAPTQEQTVEYYTVEKGDSLWKIAEKVYGNGADYNKLFEANREVIKDVDLIFPGQVIRVPK